MNDTAVCLTLPICQGMPSIVQKIIEALVYDRIQVVMKLILIPAFGIVGITANALNVAVFTKMGLSDGVAQSFLVLSIADGLTAAVITMSSICFILQHTLLEIDDTRTATTNKINWACNFVFHYLMSFSVASTVVITVVRCLCVVMPLKVKDLTSAKKQLAAVLVLSSVSIITMTIALYPSRFETFYNPASRETVIIMTGYDTDLFDYFTSVFFNGGFSIIVICVVILSFGLRKSSKFRALTTRESDGMSPAETTNTNAKSLSENNASTSAGKSGLKKRDLHIMKTVTLIAVVFIVCYLPNIVLAVLPQFLDVHPPFGRYQNLYRIFIMLRELAVLINADINIVFYIMYNSHFKSTCQRLFGKDFKKGARY